MSLSDDGVDAYESFMDCQMALNEAKDVDALAALSIDFTTPQPRFDNITALLKAMFGVGLSTVTIIEEETAVFMSRAGDWAATAPADMTICRCLIKSNDLKLLIVEDVTKDSRFMNNPFVKGPPYISFYAGAPLISTFDGRSYGTLCLVDFKPRSFSPEKYCILSQFAEIVVRELERNRVMEVQRNLLSGYSAVHARMQRALDATDEPIFIVNPTSAGWPVQYMNPPGGALVGCTDFADKVNPEQCLFWDLELATNPGELTLDFKPSHNAHLRGGGPASPDLGIPLVGEDSMSSGLLSSYTSLDPAASAALAADAALGHLTALTPDCLYYCVVRRGADGEEGFPAGALPGAPTPAALVGRGTTCIARAQGAGAMVDAIASGMGLALSGCGVSGAGALPARLFAHQPDIMKEVVLGCLIGVGSSGRTYRSMWHGGRVAVKIVECWVDPEGGLLRQRSMEQRKQQDTYAALVEAALGRALAHPHIVPTFAYASSQGEVDANGLVHSATWILQAFCSRGSLVDAILRGELATDGRPNIKAILSTAGEIAGAMAYLHSCGVMHADLSGNNVLLNAQPGDSRRWVPMVSDFGLSSIRGGQSVHSAPHGTVTHMPPELLRGGPMTPEVDVWSFGTLLWEMCSGRRAWDTLSYHQVMHAVVSGRQSLPIKGLPGVPQPLQDLMADCMSLDPTARPSFSAIGTRISQMMRIMRGRSAKRE